MKPRSIAISLAAGVVVLGGSSVAYAAQLFSSPKQVLLDSIEHDAARAASTQPQEIQFDLSVSGLQAPGSTGAVAAALSKLNGDSLSGDVIYDEANKEIQSVLRLTSAGQTYSAEGWLTSDHGIVAAADLQQWLNQLAANAGAPGLIPIIPQYLTTDRSQSTAIAAFWRKSAQNSETPAQKQAAIGLVKLLVDGIPGQYITRTRMTSIEIKFGASDLKTIADSEVSTLYQNKAEFVQDLNTLIPAGNTKLTASQLFQGHSESQTLNAVNAALNRSPITVDNVQIDATKGLLNRSMQLDMNAQVSLNPAQSGGDSGTFHFTETETVPATGTITVPQTTPANSQTFTRFFNPAN